VATEITPPILLRGLIAIGNWIRRGRTDEKPDGIRGPDWYDQAYSEVPDYRQHYTESRYYFVWAVIADRMSHSGVKKVVDLGCGSGQFALLLHDQHVSDYYGIDFSSKSIEMAKQRCPFFEFDVADLAKSDVLRRNNYDCVVSLEFLEHVEFDLELIGQIKPGTKFYGTVPNFPYTSHVRHFINEAEVQARYGRFFIDCTVDRFLENLEGRTYFLIEGTKI
jgi:2-polyprenyl-3-methyl-5-hydroxy-6-metoxy-1,4-benzoquinol methylase